MLLSGQEYVDTYARRAAAADDGPRPIPSRPGRGDRGRADRASLSRRPSGPARTQGGPRGFRGLTAPCRGRVPARVAALRRPGDPAQRRLVRPPAAGLARVRRHGRLDRRHHGHLRRTRHAVAVAGARTCSSASGWCWSPCWSSTTTRCWPARRRCRSPGRWCRWRPGRWRGVRSAGSALGSSICLSNVLERGDLTSTVASNSVYVLLTGLVIGYLAHFGVRAERALNEATETQAATAERERLARDIHDSVLQVLALVQRRGPGDRRRGGRAGAAGRRAGGVAAGPGRRAAADAGSPASRSTCVSCWRRGPAARSSCRPRPPPSCCRRTTPTSSPPPSVRRSTTCATTRGSRREPGCWSRTSRTRSW